MIRKSVPDLPDIIAKDLGHYHYGVYATHSYLEQHPAALTDARYAECDWVGFDDEHVYFSSQVWLRKKLGKRQPVIRSNNGVTILDAMIQSCGLGVFTLLCRRSRAELKKARNHRR